VSTGTSTKVMGWKHFLATVTVCFGPSVAPWKRVTPAASVFCTSALARSVPTMAVAAGSTSPV
jgi:hypothetical protein